MKRTKSKIWETFFPVPSMLKTDVSPDADLLWLLSRGIEPEALSVLRLVRGELSMTVSMLQRLAKPKLESFSFLIHDRTSGVPCAPEDTTAYIHLRLVFVKPCPAPPLRKWLFMRSVKENLGETLVHDQLNPQCAWYLRFVNVHKSLSNIELLKEVRQHLHYFANMSQMRIQ